ncbi:MAG: VCBS repeat-containing protein [Planctomycetes bacterium]|nr:VCBS repeat-containing protein [Planctomycetota bacterium]
MSQASRPVPSLATLAAVLSLCAAASAQLPPLVQSLPQPPAQTLRALGWAISSGDVDGDGFEDLVLGTPYATVAGVYPAGEAYVLPGPGLTVAIPLTPPTPQAYSRFAESVATGDVNGDGFDDVVVGAGDASPGGIFQAGAVFLFPGPTATAPLVLTDPTPLADSHFGQAVATGDVDGDGFDEVVVGAPLANWTPFGDGEVWVFAGPGLAPAISLAAPQANATFGVAVSTGDVNGDGLDDVVVGANTASPGGVGYAGSAHVFLGPTLAPVLTLFDPTPEVSGYFGFPLATGDVNGDGFDDIVVASVNADAGGIADSGEALVFLGPGLSTALTVADPTPEVGTGFGRSLAAGDFDGDGFDDLAVGVPGATSGGLIGVGEAFLFPGPGLVSAVPLADPTPEVTGNFGWGLCAADVTGDGAAEVFVGAPNADPGGVITAGEVVGFVPRFDLGLDSLSVSASAGGTVTVSLDAGNANAGRFFVLAGSGTGTSPCFPIGSVCLPIAADPVTLLFLEPSVVLQFLGSLDATGRATRSYPVGPGVFPASTIGMRIFLAYALALPFDYASRPVVLVVGP